MPLRIFDRVQETTTTTGTGPLTLAGAKPGYRSFASVLAVSDTTYYVIESGPDWEVGLGTYSAANQLTRTTVIGSSNANAAVNFGAGEKNVFITAAAEMLPPEPVIGAPSSVDNEIVLFDQATGKRLKRNPALFFTPTSAAVNSFSLKGTGDFVSRLFTDASQAGIEVIGVAGGSSSFRAISANGLSEVLVRGGSTYPTLIQILTSNTEAAVQVQGGSGGQLRRGKLAVTAANGVVLSSEAGLSLDSASGTSIEGQIHVSNLGALGLGTPGNTGTTGQVLTSAGGAAPPTWQTPAAGGGGGTITHQYAQQTTDVTLPTTNAVVDLVTLSLPAGTWLLSGVVTFRRNATTAGFLDVHIGPTGSAVASKYAGASAYHASVSGIYLNVSCQARVTLAATTSVTLSASHSAGSTNNAILANSRAGAPGATALTAIKVA